LHEKEILSSTRKFCKHPRKIIGVLTSLAAKYSRNKNTLQKWCLTSFTAKCSRKRNTFLRFDAEKFSKILNQKSDDRNVVKLERKFYKTLEVCLKNNTREERSRMNCKTESLEAKVQSRTNT